MTDAESAHRGQEAARLIESDVLAEALTAIESEVIEQWEKCPARDAEGKEALWQLYKTSKKFRGLLLGYVETGKLAADRIKLQKERSLLGRVLQR
jgi:hypothetical protein